MKRNTTKKKLILRYLSGIALLIMYMNSYSQSRDVESLTVSVDTTMSVVNVLNQISRLPNLNFAFDETELDLDQIIDFSKKDSFTIKEIMDIVSKRTGTSYRIVGKQIILKKTKSEKKFTLSGQIKDGETGEDLIGAVVKVKGLSLGTVSNVYGFYSLTLEEGDYDIIFSYVGYESISRSVSLSRNITQSIELTEDSEILGEVVIIGDREADANVTSLDMGSTDVKIETVKKLPALFGEVDIIKTIQLLPGVATVGEGSSGFYVRGGNVDQNLVLLDEAPIYNASHVLGFFSSFNPDAIKDMKLYKAAIPAQFGGRLSSVLDIRMKEGNSKKLSGSAGIGTTMSRMALEAPIGKKASFMIAGRRSYIDILAKGFQKLRGRNSLEGNQFYFYDLNTKANYRIDDKNRVFVSGYFGRDVISTELDSTRFDLNWGNATSTIRWNHLFSPKFFSNLTYYYSNYDYFLASELEAIDFRWTSRLSEHSLKADFGIYINPENTLSFGINSIRHNINPGQVEITLAGSNDRLDIQTNTSLESAFYINNEQSIGKKFKIDYGLRVSSIHNLGSQDVFVLDQNFEISDTLKHGKGVFNQYWNPEPRIGMRYQLSKTSSVKSSYNRTAQYIQLASNGNTSTPLDIWFSSSQRIKPQLADQFTIGYFKNFNNNMFEFSAEGYYKKFTNAIDFKDNGALLLNPNLEGELRIGKARAYGLELMLRKNIGRATGWVSYTLSKAEKKINTVNEDRWYNAKFDKPHDLSVVTSLALTDRVSVGGSFVYASGGAVSFPVSRYTFGDRSVPVFSERNGARLPNFHRLDLSLTVQNKKNNSRRFQSEWVLGLYNVYNRKNAFAINFNQEENDPTTTFAVKQAVFSIVPSFTYNAHF